MTKFAFLAALPLLALAQPAAAQSVSSSAYRDTLEFARCALASTPVDVQALLGAVPGSPDDRALTSKIANTADCTPKPKLEALRGALAERSYLATYPAPPAAPAGPVSAFQGSGKAALANWDITRCAAQRDPVTADALIRSEPRSAEEKEALKRFLPVIGACTPAGFQIGFDREKMRGLVAEGLTAVRKASAN